MIMIEKAKYTLRGVLMGWAASVIGLVIGLML